MSQQTMDTSEGIAPRKRRTDDAEIDITPMIDIVFLLLAFFVIVSKMDPASAVKMPRARYGDTIPDGSCVTLVVAETDKETPLVYLGKAKNEDSLVSGATEDIAEKIAEYVEKELTANAESTTVLIKAERKVKSRHVVLVKDAVSKGINKEIHKIYVGIEEE